MWIVLPLIGLMSWRTCRSIGQAFNETVAWVVGYLVTAGALLALHVGHPALVSVEPDDLPAVFPFIGGFVGMGVARYLWKRRGGHLKAKRRGSLAQAAGRAYRASRATGVKPPGPTPPSPTETPTSTTGGKTGTTSSGVEQWARAAGRAYGAMRSGGASASKKATPSSPSTGSTNKWARATGRAIGAMLAGDQRKRPPQR